MVEESRAAKYTTENIGSTKRVEIGGVTTRNGLLLFALSIALGLAVCLALSSCGGGSIVGSWQKADGSSSYAMTFWDGGSCENVTHKGRTSDVSAGHYTKYELQSDGTVMIIGDYWGDRAATVKRTDSKEQASESYDLYYLNGDSLVWDKVEYKRV